MSCGGEPLKRLLPLVLLCILLIPPVLGVVGSIENITQPVKESVLSYEERPIQHTACDGSRDSDPFITGDYWDTWEDDASYLTADSSFFASIYLVFNITETRLIGEINFFLRWQVSLNPGPDPTLYWKIYNFDTSSWDTVYSVELSSTLNFENREESIIYDDKYVNSTNHVRFAVSSSNTYAEDIEVDYAYLTVATGYDGEFRESIPDDVLYYPDPLEHTASDGSVDSDPFITGDYWDTWEDDASYLTADSTYSVSIDLVFNITEYSNFIVDNATLNFFLRWQVSLSVGPDPMLYWAIWNFDTSSWDTVYSVVLSSALNFENREESIIYDDKYVNSTNHVRFTVYANNTYADDIEVDYAYVTATNHYTESFADVSDWDDYVAPDAFSSDGDVLTIESTADGSNDYEAIYSNNPNTSIGAYLEFYYRTETTSIDYISVRVYAEDDHAGTMTEYRPTITTSWTAYKVRLTQVCESIVIGLRHDDDVSPDNDLYFDYVGIRRADEMGWQHDASTIHGTTNGAGDFTYSNSTDGDIIQLNITANATSWCDFKFNYDTTSTVAKPERNYYQFMKIRWRMTAFTGNYIGLRIDYDDYRRDTASGETGYYTSPFAWTTDIINVATFTSSDVEPSNVRIIGKFDSGENATVEIDFVKFYSILNYTITQSSTSIDDFLYVSAGVLYSEIDSGSITLNYDPAIYLNESISDRYTWTKETSSGDSYLSFYDDIWTDYATGTEGEINATTTDMRIQFTEDADIMSITFSPTPPHWYLVGNAPFVFRVPYWNLANSAPFDFYIPVDEFVLASFFMLIGMIMIPASTLYLVKDRRENMNSDRAFFFLLLFLMGWALILGGIFF
jgi:hypothetical protein